MFQPGKNSLDAKLIIQLVYQKKWLILGCLLGVLIPILLVNYKSKPMYEVKTSIMYEHYQDVMENNTRFKPIDKSIINNAIEEIRSLSLASDLVLSLPGEIVNTIPVPEKRPANFDSLAYFVRIMRKKIMAESITGSDVIVIKARDKSPETAVVLAQMVTDVLIRRNLQARHQTISNVRKMIEEQLRLAEERLKAAEEALRTYKEKGDITYINEESREILKRITEAEVLYNKARTDRDAAEKRLNYLQEKLTSERKELLPLITESTSPFVKRLKDEMLELEIQYTKLKVQNYAEDHPKMQELKLQIDQTKEKLLNETLKIKQGKDLIDPLSQIQKFMEEIVNLEIEVQTFQAQEQVLEQINKEYEKELKSVPEKELILARLEREKEVNNKLYIMLTEKREEARIKEAEKFANIKVLDPPIMPDKPIWPKKLLNLILGLFFGIILSSGIIIFLEYFDTRLKTTDQVNSIANLNVVGVIPRIKKGVYAPTRPLEARMDRTGNKAMLEKLIYYHGIRSMEVEVFRKLRTNLQFSGLGTSLKSILVTSCGPGDGKSFITTNLGIALAQMSLKTILVDADLRKPRLHSLFGEERQFGLSNIIMANQVTMALNQKKLTATATGHQEIEVEAQQQHLNDFFENHEFLIDNMKSEKIIHPTMIPYLDLMTSGKISPDQLDILSFPALPKIIESLGKEYDVVLLDSSPVNVVVDASILGSIVDGVLLVVKTWSNTRPGVLKAIETLKTANTNLLGIVVNWAAEEEFRYNDYFSKNGHQLP